MCCDITLTVPVDIIVQVVLDTPTAIISDGHDRPMPKGLMPDSDAHTQFQPRGWGHSITTNETIKIVLGLELGLGLLKCNDASLGLGLVLVLGLGLGLGLVLGALSRVAFMIFGRMFRQASWQASIRHQ